MSSSLRVLIADDEALHNLALSSQLQQLGHEVVGTASNGREAIALAKETQPDLVFLDIRMPEMTGPEAAQAISSRTFATCWSRYSSLPRSATSTSSRMSSPVANGNECRSPGHSAPIRRRCWRTSRCRWSTPRCAQPC